MQTRQKVIAEWMADVMVRRNISARRWSEKALLGKDTVSRAMRDDYQFVTSTTTLAKLADAVSERPPGAAGAIPSVESLTEVVDVLQQTLLGEARLGPGPLRIFAAALRDTLLSLADEPGGADDPKVSTAIARASLRQQQTLHA